MKKFRKSIIAIASLAVIAALFGGCTVKETRIIESPTTQATTTIATTTLPARQPERLSIDMAIAAAKESAPGLWIYTDSEMIQLMQTACDSLDDWNGDYDAFLQNAQTQMSGESSSLIQETSALVSAATFSLCTEHQVGLLDALDRAGSY
jgi:hypothetical protein